MKMKTKAREQWVIQDKEGNLLPGTNGDTALKAFKQYLGPNISTSAAMLERVGAKEHEGYRAIVFREILRRR